MNLSGIIYLAINKINGKMYIGQTIDFKRRIYQHRIIKDNCAIHKAIIKYGWNNFEWHIIDICHGDANNLNILEKHYIEHFGTYHYGYNETFGGQGVSRLDFKHSEKTKRKMSQTRKHMQGKPHTNETKQILSVKKKEYFKDPDNLIKNRLQKHKKAIHCIELNKNFNSMHEACRELKLDMKSLGCHLRKKPKYYQVKGYQTILNKLRIFTNQ